MGQEEKPAGFISSKAGLGGPERQNPSGVLHPMALMQPFGQSGVKN